MTPPAARALPSRSLQRPTAYEPNDDQLLLTRPTSRTLSNPFLVRVRFTGCDRPLTGVGVGAPVPSTPAPPSPRTPQHRPILGAGLHMPTGAAWLDLIATSIIALFASPRRQESLGKQTCRGRGRGRGRGRRLAACDRCPRTSPRGPAAHRPSNISTRGRTTSGLTAARGTRRSAHTAKGGYATPSQGVLR